MKSLFTRFPKALAGTGLLTILLVGGNAAFADRPIPGEMGGLLGVGQPSQPQSQPSTNDNIDGLFDPSDLNDPGMGAGQPSPSDNIDNLFDPSDITDPVPGSVTPGGGDNNIDNLFDPSDLNEPGMPGPANPQTDDSDELLQPSDLSSPDTQWSMGQQDDGVTSYLDPNAGLLTD